MISTGVLCSAKLISNGISVRFYSARTAYTSLLLLHTKVFIVAELCWPECQRQLSLETVPHIVSFYLVIPSWLEISRIVSDCGSKESYENAWGLLHIKLWWEIWFGNGTWISCNA